MKTDVLFSPMASVPSFDDPVGPAWGTHLKSMICLKSLTVSKQQINQQSTRISTPQTYFGAADGRYSHAIAAVAWVGWVWIF